MATVTELATLEKKIPSISSLVKKTDCNTKITEIGKKLIDPNPKTLAANVFNARLTQAKLITKTDFDATLSSLNRKITANESKHLLVENECSSYFGGKSRFEEDGIQDYLVFQPINRYFKVIANTDYVLSWKSKGYHGYLPKLLSYLIRLIIVLLQH